MLKTNLDIQLQTLPHQPGVYQYFDKDGKILYVGKAKDLKKRVSSYFTKQQDYGKTRVLVKKIASIKHIVVDTETDALLLEITSLKSISHVIMFCSRTINPILGFVLKTNVFPEYFQHEEF